LARLKGIHCLISGAFVTMLVRRRLSEVDKRRALVWPHDGLAVRDVARHLVLVVVIEPLSHSKTETDLTAAEVRQREGTQDGLGPPAGSETDLLFRRPLATQQPPPVY